jgi:SNF2 family DNA or RNA helicase
LPTKPSQIFATVGRRRGSDEPRGVVLDNIYSLLCRSDERILLQYKLKPWAHQQKAIDEAIRLPHYAFFMEMGTGKTLAAINTLRYRYYAHGKLLRTLVLAPPITLENWKREFHMSSNLKDNQVIVLYGPQKKRMHIFQNTCDQPRVYITNYEALLMKQLYPAIEQWQPEAIIFDESHKLKSSKSKRTKIATKLADMAQHKYLLTGTPVLNSPMDLFSQFRIMDGGSTFGKNFISFRALYFYDKNASMPRHRYFPDWRIRPGSYEAMNKKIFTKAIRVTKDECMDLPPLVRKNIYVDLSPEQAKVYKEMSRDFISYINDKACVASLAITKALRLQQIVSGFIKDEDGTEHSFGSTPRQKALREILEDLIQEHKVCVWAVFKQNYKQIKDILEDMGVGYVEVHGDVKSSERFESVDRFNDDSKCRVFLGHPGSGGIGINLVAASYSIFYSRGFSLEHDLQAEARNYRGGSERHAKITRIDIVSRDTIDELIQKALSNKQNISEKLLKEIGNELTKITR